MTAALVPELLVTDIEASLRFWRDLIGFQILYDRPEEGFAYLKMGCAEIMLEERSEDRRNWVTAPLEAPYGRGINFQIECDDVTAAAARFSANEWPFFLPLEEKTYRTGTTEARVRQFIVQDPDGYLVRLSEQI
jgi:catechol 2,3-dioxygenase-like lactoylglutathione lyase family enzyme